MRYQYIIFFSILSLNASSQSPGEFTSYSVKDGLSDNRTYDIVQDDRGFIWLATANGLNFFDGNNFTIYNTNNSGLKSNIIYEIKKGQSHELVLATGYGAVIIDSRTAIMNQILIPSVPELAVKVNTIRHIEYTSRNELVLGSDVGIYVMDRTGKIIDSVRTEFKAEELRKSWLHFTRGLASFPNGDALVSTTNGFYLYDHEKKKITGIDHLENKMYEQMISFLSRRGRSYIYEINRFNQLFFIDNLSFVDSIFIIDIPGKKIISNKLPFPAKDNIRWDSKIQFHGDSLVSITTARSGYYLFSFGQALTEWRLISGKIADNFFTQCVLRDNSMRFWVGTETGFLKENSHFPEINNISITPFVTGGNYHPVAAVYSTDTRWWIAGYSRESGLMVLDTSFRLLKRIEFEKKPDDKNFVVSIIRWTKDTLLVGTKSGVWFVDINSYKTRPFSIPGTGFNLSGIIIQNSFRDSKGLLWLSGGQVGGVWQIDQEKGSVRHFVPGNSPSHIPLRKAISFAEDNNGDIWMTHWVDGLARWDSKKQIFDTLIQQHDVKGNFVFSCSGVTNAGGSDLWLFINSYGLVKYNIPTGTFKRFVATNDRADDNDDCVLMTGQKYLWINLRHSIILYNTRDNTYITLTTRNGLPEESNASGKPYFDSLKQVVAIGFSNMVSFINCNSAENISSDFKVFISGVKNLKDGSYRDFNQPVVLKNRENDLLVKFAVPDLDKLLPFPEFEYRLSKDGAWKSTGSKNTLNLNNLPPDLYNLQIRIAGDNMPGNDSIAGIEIKILPPFYKTAWFYLSVFLVVVFLAYGVYRIRKNQFHALQKVRDNISADLHDDIGSRLTNIRMLSIVSENEMTSTEEKKEYLKRISEQALASGEALDEIVRNMTIQDEEIEDIIARMRHYAGSVFNNGITNLKMEVEEPIILKKMNLEKRRDLLLAFKEILNNIRKHAEAKTVFVKLTTEGKSLFLEVKDDGIGFDVNEFTDRSGIKNIKSRIQKWGGEVIVISEKERGTTIDIHLPF